MIYIKIYGDLNIFKWAGSLEQEMYSEMLQFNKWFLLLYSCNIFMVLSQASI